MLSTITWHVTFSTTWQGLVPGAANSSWYSLLYWFYVGPSYLGVAMNGYVAGAECINGSVSLDLEWQ
jgi:hypothetical protein